MRYSSLGKKLGVSYGAFFLANIVVLALSARVNQFQEFFFVADLFPLGLSIFTLVFLSFIILFDFGLENPVTSRAPFTIGSLSILSILWLAFNAFSTSRWQHVPLMCDSIPPDYQDEIVWCKDLQALKSFVWIEWVILVITLFYVTRYCLKQYTHGNNHVWSIPLSRYDPRVRMDSTTAPQYGFGFEQRQSEFLQFEKMAY